MTEQELIFAMDIGTRTVVGIVGYHDGEKFKIVAHEIEAHKERAMYDGQVHDIELVSKAAQKVVERLEKKIGNSLKKVAIAAAGRSLKTCKVYIERDADPSYEVDKELISSLEIEAIQKAQSEIEVMAQEDDTAYYCVGYAVVNYFLNGGIIGNLEGHKAKKLGMEVLATFLPRLVVDSLYAVVTRIGLEVSSLTLEPIAAMNVSIHSNLRLLNIALVDIGAGTSDIALTKGGTVFAFAMAPVAGDEITEKLAENYLLDFDTAEKVKISLCKKGTIKYKDIMGFEYEKSSEEMIKTIEATIKMLAQEIASRIIEFNGKAPSAVFLIGGGSQIPHLGGFIAEYLQIPPERVGVRKTDIIRDVENKFKKLAGPEFITPIGIAVTAFLNREKDFLQVTVNDMSVKLFNSKALNVADALILVGYNPRHLIGRRGNAITFKINGKPEMVKGEHGEPAKIYVNGTKTSLDKSIIHGDKIIVDPATDGMPAIVYVKDYMYTIDEKQVFINGKRQLFKPLILVNGDIKDPQYKINDGDDIEIKRFEVVSDFVDQLGVSFEDNVFYNNGMRVKLGDPVVNGDNITFLPVEKTIEAVFTGIEVWVNEKQLKLQEKKTPYIFVDLFNYLNIDLKSVRGKVTMLLNEKNANYMDELKHGDRIIISWEL